MSAYSSHLAFLKNHLFTEFVGFAVEGEKRTSSQCCDLENLSMTLRCGLDSPKRTPDNTRFGLV